MAARGAGAAASRDGLTSEEARALGDACVAAIEYLGGCDVRRSDPVPRALLEVCFEGIRLAAATLALRPDPADLPRFAQWSLLIERVERPAPSHSTLAGETLAALVSAGGELDDAVRDAVESGHVLMRSALAYSLRPVGPGSVALLRLLAADSDSTVHAAARKHLATVEEVAWWRGKFSRDPLALLSPHAQKTAGPALAALNEALASPEHEDGHWERVRAAVDALPAPVAIDFLVHRFEGKHDYDPGALLLLGALLWRPNAEDAIWKLCESWSKSSWLALSLYRSSEEKPRLEEGSVEHRTAQCVSLTRRIFALDRKTDRDDARPSVSARELVVTIVAHQWPIAADPTPLVEALLHRAPDATGDDASGDDDDDHARAVFVRFLADEVPAGAFPEALVERFVLAHAQGYPRPWGALAALGHALIKCLPVARRRVLAQRLLAERPDDSESVGWALEVLSGDGYDEALDGPRARLARAWIAAPALRSAVLESDPVDDRVLPFVREEMLLRGKLSYKEACSVASTVRQLFGEGAAGDDGDDEGDEGDEEEETDARSERRARARQARLERLGPWLSSGGRVGPLGDDEIAKLREARDREPGRALPSRAKRSAVRRARAVSAYLDACPGRTSRWTPEESSVADEWFELHARENALAEFAHFALARALDAADRPRDLRWFEAYFPRLDRDYSGEARRLYERFCARVGLAPDPRIYDPELRPPAAKIAPDPDEDEDEDEGEDE